MDDDKWLYTPIDPALADDMEAGADERMQGVAVPVAVAEQARCHGHDEILYARVDLAIRAYMLKQKKIAARLQDAPDLLKTLQWIGDGAEDERFLNEAQ